MSSETDSDYETYKRTSLTRSVEYDRLYKGGDNTLSSTPFATESESLYKNEYDEYGGHYAQYQNHSKCGRQIDFENEYAEYECGRSETGSEKAQKAKKQLCMRCWISFLILFLLGSVIFGILAVFDKTDIFKNSIDNSISFEFTKDSNFTEPFSSTTTKTITSTTVRTTEPTEKPFPNAIELAGTTTENYWKDYQLLGLYNIHGTKNGAPSYKRARNAFILGSVPWTKPLRFFYLGAESGPWILFQARYIFGSLVNVEKING